MLCLLPLLLSCVWGMGYGVCKAGGLHKRVPCFVCPHRFSSRRSGTSIIFGPPLKEGQLSGT